MEIAGETILRGKSRRIDLKVSKNYDFTDVIIPIQVITGKADGPSLFLTAGMHGDEILGVEVIRRILASRHLKKVKGTLIVVPVVNALALNSKSRYLPDRRDLNRCFPGTGKGSLGAQIADILMEEVVLKCTHGIDIHTGAIHRPNFPQIRACLDNPDVIKMADSFNAPVILDSALRDGSLRQAAHAAGIPTLVFEGGEALRMDEKSIRTAVMGVFSVMQHIGMLPQIIKTNKQKELKSFIAKSSSWVRAEHSGMFRIRKKIGSFVKKGDWLGTISDPFGAINHRIVSNQSGIIIGQTNLPLINNGDALFHIARFEDNQEVGEHVRVHEELMEEDLLSERR